MLYLSEHCLAVNTDWPQARICHALCSETARRCPRTPRTPGTHRISQVGSGKQTTQKNKTHLTKYYEIKHGILYKKCQRVELDQAS